MPPPSPTRGPTTASPLNKRHPKRPLSSALLLRFEAPLLFDVPFSFSMFSVLSLSYFVPCCCFTAFMHAAHKSRRKQTSKIPPYVWYVHTFGTTLDSVLPLLPSAQNLSQSSKGFNGVMPHLNHRRQRIPERGHPLGDWSSDNRSSFPIFLLWAFLLSEVRSVNKIRTRHFFSLIPDP